MTRLLQNRHMFGLAAWPAVCLTMALATGPAILSSGCATSLSSEEASTSLTPGPQVEPEADETDLRIQQLLIRGLTRALVDDHRQAVFLFEQALQLDENQPAVLHALAESHAALGELDTSLYYGRRAIKLAPNNRDYMLSYVGLQERYGDPQGALHSYEQWLTVYPGDTEIRLLAGELLIDMGREQEALVHYRDILENDGDNLEVRFRMLQLYNGMGNTVGMLSTVEAMLEIDPANSALLRILADIRIERNEIEEAISVLEEAVRADPGDIEATLALAQLYRETGREAEAEELTASASNDPLSTTANRIAVASELYGRSESDPKAAEQAAAILEDLIESGDQSADALFMLGNLRYRDHLYAEAAEFLVRALDIDPRHPDEWARAATCLYRSGDAARALEVADEAAMLFPGQYPILSIGTEAALETGNFVRAERFASEALGVLDDGANKEHLRAGTLDRLGDALAGQGKIGEAQTYWRQALVADPTIDGIREKLQSIQ